MVREFSYVLFVGIIEHFIKFAKGTFHFVIIYIFQFTL